MRALDRKLLRELWEMKTQALAIALVIAAGIALYVAYLSNFHSLDLTLDTYYERQRFADVFASLKRAPRRLADRIAEIPGVAQVHTQVVVDVNVDVDGMIEPAVGRLVSIPEVDRDHLNDLYLRRGRYLEPGRSDEILISEGFAEAHGFEPGDTVAAIVNGTRRRLEIVGIALSPEYVYTIRPGDLFPDDTRFGIFWMERRALASAFDMEGGFNTVALKLVPEASKPEVIARLDALLEPYGGLGAIPRELQLSHWTMSNELAQLSSMGVIIPAIFLSVAAFLLNVVMARVISVQREQIAALKALGYSNASIGVHYVKLGMAIAFLGALLGVTGGLWLGNAMAHLYATFFRFPILYYELPPQVLVNAFAISLGAAVLGVVSTVRKAVRLPPAEAMRPEPPANYRRTLLERLGLAALLSPPTRMVLRNLERRPLRAALSVLGIGFACALLVVGLFFVDSMDVLLDMQFNVVQREDVTITFYEPTSPRARYELARLPGVLQLEPLRMVPVRLRHGYRSRQLALTGIPRDAELQRIVGADFRTRQLPAAGLVLSEQLAQVLRLQPGQMVTVEVLEGRRPVYDLPVTSVVDDFMGLSAYMELGSLHRLLREDALLSGARLRVDKTLEPALYQRLKETPGVAGVGLKRAALENFQETMGQNMNTMIFFNILFAGIIAFGVVYNAARISLSERSRELASLRVLGFTRAEISGILLGELAVVTLLALPVGLLIGSGLSALAVEAMATELYRFPLVLRADSLLQAAGVVAVAALLSGLAVRRRLDRLDLVEVLKTRE